MELSESDETHRTSTTHEKPKHYAKGGHRHRKRAILRDMKWAFLVLSTLCVLNIVAFKLRW